MLEKPIKSLFLLKILLISLTKSPALAIIFNSLCAKGDEEEEYANEEEEYANLMLTEKAARRLRGAPEKMRRGR